MNISIFGLGYVGVVTAACLARDGHKVIGVDIEEEKVDLINAGQSPIFEEKIDELIGQAVVSSQLRATVSTREAISETDMAIVCVGTPSREDGSLETRYVQTVTQEIGEALRNQSRDFLVVIRSTVLPGTVRSIVMPLLEETSGKKLGSGIEVVFHPEFLREGSSVKDFYAPPRIVVGERIQGTGKQVVDLYEKIEAPRHFCSLEMAEMIKYADNLFHAVKITFANEIGLICHCYDIDSRQIMEIFCTDTKLNISPAYLRPGFAFGGSCLPKDLRAILALSREGNIAVPMLEHVMTSNQKQVERVLQLILSNNSRIIGFYGLTFKPGTDDLRESPLVELAERLLGKGFVLHIQDKFVQVNQLFGKNKAYIEHHLPHLAKLLVKSPDELNECDTILLGHPANDEEINKWLRSGIRVIDLTGGNRFPEAENYQTIV